MVRLSGMGALQGRQKSRAGGVFGRRMLGYAHAHRMLALAHACGHILVRPSFRWELDGGRGAVRRGSARVAPCVCPAWAVPTPWTAGNRTTGLGCRRRMTMSMCPLGAAGARCTRGDYSNTSDVLPLSAPSLPPTRPQARLRARLSAATDGMAMLMLCWRREAEEQSPRPSAGAQRASAPRRLPRSPTASPVIPHWCWDHPVDTELQQGLPVRTDCWAVAVLGRGAGLPNGCQLPRPRAQQVGRRRRLGWEAGRLAWQRPAPRRGRGFLEESPTGAVRMAPAGLHERSNTWRAAALDDSRPADFSGC